MRKSALISLGLLSSTLVHANTSVSTYGVLDIAYGNNKSVSRDGTANKKTSGLLDGSWSGNRIGFKGREDLGQGMAMSFLVELGFSPTNANALAVRAGTSGHQDNNTNTTPTGGTASLYKGGGSMTGGTNRQSWMGLSSNLGELRMGYQNTNYYTLGSQSGFIAGPEVSGGDTLHTFNSSKIGGTRANGLTYISPVFQNGFQATVQRGAGNSVANAVETTTTTTENGAVRTGAMLTYNAKQLRAGINHTVNKVTTNGAAVTAKMTQMVASYDFGSAVVMGIFNRGSDGANVAESHYKAQVFTVKLPLGQNELFASVGKGNTEKNGTAARTEDVSQRLLGMRHLLSKRSTVYLLHGTTKDEAIVAPSSSYKGTTTRLGMTHVF